VRKLLIVVLSAFFTIQASAALLAVDLDQPGALEALKKNRPEHYAKVIEAMEQVQAVPYSPTGQRDLRLEFPKPGATGTQVETSHPAKSRISIPVDDLEYRITVVYTKYPAKAIPAK
jgi:hypothetical protein